MNDLYAKVRDLRKDGRKLSEHIWDAVEAADAIPGADDVSVDLVAAERHLGEALDALARARVSIDDRIPPLLRGDL